MILSSDAHPEKAEAPMLVTLSDIVIIVKPMQLEKAESAILVPLVISTTKEVGLACFATIPTISAGPDMRVRPVQPLNAESPTLITLCGIVILERFVKP